MGIEDVKVTAMNMYKYKYKYKYKQFSLLLYLTCIRPVTEYEFCSKDIIDMENRSDKDHKLSQGTYGP